MPAGDGARGLTRRGKRMAINARVRLGSAASGGVPQWKTAGARTAMSAGRLGQVKPRTQDSAALSAGANGGFC
jgi:hypothetical protein